MGRRLTRRELLDLLNQTRQQLDAQEPHYPAPSLDLDREGYLQQRRSRAVLLGRRAGLAEAASAILLRNRWGPVNQARVHDGLLEASHRVCVEREQERAFGRTLKQPEQEIEVCTSIQTGQLDALRAVSKAIAGYPDLVRDLVEIERPLHAHGRQHDQDRGAGYD